MPFNGSGTFVGIAPPDYPAVANTTIRAAQFNANMTDLFAGLSDCLTRDGQAPMTANLPMGGKKITGMAVGTATGDAAAYEQTVGVLTGVQVFSTPGTFTYTPSAGTTKVLVEVIGGGGSGGGAALAASNISFGHGGSGGGYAKKLITSAFSGVTVTVGAGGVGASGAQGTAGGSSSFGAIVSATGGGAGQSWASTFGVVPFIFEGTYNPGNGSGGDLNITGGIPGPVLAQSNTRNSCSRGGSSFMGNGTPSAFMGSQNGANGTGYGSGGGGAMDASASGPYTGGNGAGGIVIIHEFK